MIDPRFDYLRSLLRDAGWTVSADKPETFENRSALLILANSLDITMREGRSGGNPAFAFARAEATRLAGEA